MLAEIGELSKATGRNVFRDLVDTFLSDLSPRIKLLRTALESSNMNQLALVTHPLRSASAIVGAKKFSDICAAVERYARDGKMDQASSLTGELLDAAQMLPGAFSKRPTISKNVGLTGLLLQGLGGASFAQPRSRMSI